MWYAEIVVLVISLLHCYHAVLPFTCAKQTDKFIHTMKERRDYPQPSEHWPRKLGTNTTGHPQFKGFNYQSFAYTVRSVWLQGNNLFIVCLATISKVMEYTITTDNH